MSETAVLARATEARDPTVEERLAIERAEANGRRRVGEELVYRWGQRTSYYGDMALIARGNSTAGERMERHGRQMQAVTIPDVRRLAGVEYRVNPSTAKEHGGEFAPPLWINELFATARRPGEVIQRLAPVFDLPFGVSSVNLPRITQGAEASQAVDNAPIDDRDIETKPVEGEVATGSGMSDWSMQTFEQSPAGAHLDWVVFTDLTEALDAEIETELVVGPGTGERVTGLVNIAGTNTITYTSAAPTGTGLFPELGRALAQVGIKRFRPPTAVLMSSGRFFWLATSEDNANRPLSLTDYPVSDFPIVGLAGVGVYLDDAIPNNLTTAGKTGGGEGPVEADVIIACRPSDWVLMMGPPKTHVNLDVLSGTLQARFVIHRSYAALLGRYPSGISVVSGTGMKVPAGFS